MHEVVAWGAALLSLIGFGLAIGVNPALYGATADMLARDVDERRERDDWFLALAAARNEVCDEARAAVDVAMRLTGSRGFQADSELARLYRDVLAGLFHPSSSAALAATVRGSLADPA